MSQIGIMYLICGAALFFYVTRVPEIWFPGIDAALEQSNKKDTPFFLYLVIHVCLRLM